MITKHDHPVAIFFSMQDVVALFKVNDDVKKQIHAGIMSGIADAETGRVSSSGQQHLDKIKEKLKSRFVLDVA